MAGAGNGVDGLKQSDPIEAILMLKRAAKVSEAAIGKQKTLSQKTFSSPHPRRPLQEVPQHLQQRGVPHLLGVLQGGWN